MPTKKKPPMRRWTGNVYFQYDLDVEVSARTKSEARRKMHHKIANRKIGLKAIDKQMTDPESEPIW